MPTLAYVATLNNYTADDVAVLRTPNSKLTYIIVGHEVGEQGTPHLQIYFQLEKQAKLTTIKNWGGPWARMHLEPARGTDVEAADYCKKEGNYFELGTRRTTGRGARNDLYELQKAVDNGLSYEKICELFFSECAKYHLFVQQQIHLRDTNKELTRLRLEYESCSLRPWQQALKDVVSEDPNPRKIHWLWEDKGNTGKSWMTKYLAAVHNACILQPGKKADMAYLYSKNPSKVAVFDLSRTLAPGDERNWTMDAVYSLAEDLKNGLVTSYKYNSANVITRGCHVIFFANFSPDMTKWSQDRYFITKI